MTTSPHTIPAAPNTSAARVAAGIAVAAVGAVLVNALIAVLARALGASDGFQPLWFSVYALFTVIGVLIGAAAWALIRRFTRRPASLLRWLVPTVVALSLIPDIGLLFADGQPNTSGLAVAALMLMHVATAVVAVPVFRRVLPVSDRN